MSKLEFKYVNGNLFFLLHEIYGVVRVILFTSKIGCGFE